MNKECFDYLLEKYNNSCLPAEDEKQLYPYRVDNAIIMAAGMSKRCMPLSGLVPKGLFRVKGEVLIEREIRQLLSAGVDNIIIVVGYKAEMFEYLKNKYNITLVQNNEYMTKNNISSIYAVREYLANTYICCADNYYEKNIFSKYEYESYYTCVYTEEYADEYCITENEDGYIKNIKRGGREKWFTIGANYWTRSFSEKMRDLLESEYGNPEIYNLLIDDFHLRHIDSLPIQTKKYDKKDILEFDTIDEFEAFDPDFRHYEKQLIAGNLYGRYKGVTRYAGVKTDVRVRLHFNENLWGPSPNSLLPLKESTLQDLYLYDSTDADILCSAISEKYGFPYDSVFLHNSGSEMVRSITTIMVEKGDRVLLPLPHWSYYPGIVDYRFGEKIFYGFHEKGEKCYHDVDDIMEKAEAFRPKMIIITSPAMPSGNLIKPQDLEKVVKNNPWSLVYVDQAYFGFEDDPIDVNYFIERYDNVMFARTFSKFFALAGLRLGYGVASKRALETLWLDLPLLRLPVTARRSAIECLKDDDYYNRVRNEIKEVKNWFFHELVNMDNIHPYESDTNFIYMRVIGVDAVKLREKMMEQGYLFRIFEYNEGQFYRINVAPRGIMEEFVDKLKATIKALTV